MDYEYWRQHGVYFASNEQKITDFLTTLYPGFDLGQVLDELARAASARGFAWDRIQVEITTMGNLHIQHHYDTQNHDEEPLRLRRILKKPSESGRRVSHEEMILPESMQRQGVSRDLMRPYYRQYKAANVDYIDVHATLSGGGYAWARYGFDAAREQDVLAILRRALTLNIDAEYVCILAEEAERFYQSHPPGTPFRMWDWAQTPFAKELLVGTEWHAVLDLHNSEQVAIFEEYLDFTS